MAKQKDDGLKFKVTIGILTLAFFYLLFKISIGANVKIHADTYYYYVPEKTSPEIIADTLKRRGYIISRLSFRLMASIESLEYIEPGMYEVQKDWSNHQLITHFKEYKPKPTSFITLPALRSRNSVIKEFCRGTGVHPDDMWKLLNNPKFIKSLGGEFDKESIFAIFLPRNYRVYKKSTAEDLIRRLYQEYLLFWNSKRLKQAKEMGLSPSEVFILSSIVYSETKQEDEMPIIAGVYLNRIQKNMRLESDPTLLYAKNKLGARRVFYKDKDIDSPYNTYKNKGLPPGPIYIIPTWVIDKVLEYEGHDYLYFCANPNFSGVHLFAETFEEHKENAQRYRNKLNEEKIF